MEEERNRLGRLGIQHGHMVSELSHDVRGLAHAALTTYNYKGFFRNLMQASLKSAGFAPGLQNMPRDSTSNIKHHA